MNEPKYQIGDCALVAGLPVEIVKHFYSKPLATNIYIVRFEITSAMSMVEERDLETINRLKSIALENGDRNINPDVAG